MSDRENWHCIRCITSQHIDAIRTAIYITKSSFKKDMDNMDDYYLLIGWVCEKCKKEMKLNEHTISCKISLIENELILREIHLSRVSNDKCSICKELYEANEDYGICLYDEKWNIEEEAFDTIDAVQVFNICTNCYKNINSYLEKGSGIQDPFFSLESHKTGLQRKLISGNMLKASIAFGNMADDGEKMQIVDNLHRIDFDFIYE